MSISYSQGSPLRLLLTNSSSIYGGGEFYVFQLAQTLQRRGHSVWVSCRSDNLLLEKCRGADIPTFPMDFPAQGEFVKYVSRIARLLRNNQIHLVHSNTNYDRTAAAFAARIVGCSHVTNVHSFHSIQHNLTHWIRNRIATDHFLVDGFCVKELLEKKDRILPEKISVVHLGVEPDSMVRDETLRRSVRESFGFIDEHVVIGNVARLVPFKGHTVLLKAFAKIAQRFPSSRLLLVGDGELYDDLRRSANELGVAQQTVFAGFRDDLQAMYSAFDVYVHPSFEGGGETFPFAVLQALAQELPVVVTKVGDVPAMVQERRNGFVVPDNNPKALAEKLGMLLAERKLREHMGQASRRLLLERFTLERMVDSIEGIYRSVVEKRSKYR